MVLYSSQWTGWVPGNCGGDGNLAASSFGVLNLRIQASVVQGPEPTKCSGPSPGPSPPTPPSPGETCQVTAGYDCVGEDISDASRQHVGSQGECCTLCQKTSGC